MNNLNIDLGSIYKRSFKLFCEHQLGVIVGNMHTEIVNALESKSKNLCVMASRGHSKTTIVSVAYPLWLCYKSPTPEYIIIVSMNQNESRRIMGLIRDEIFKHNDFLGFQMKMDSADEVQIFIPGTNLHHTICSIPLGTRGRHGTILIADDILKDEQGNTIPSITKVKNLFWKAHSPMIEAKKGILAVVGTPICSNDLYNDIIELIETERKRGLDPSWNFLKYPAIKPDGSLQFPEFYTEERLLRKKLSVPSYVWEQEYMLNPVGDGYSIFPIELIESASNLDYKPIDKSEQDFVSNYIGCDVAMSSSSRADNSAFYIVTKAPNRPIKVTDCWIGHGIGEDQQIEKIKELKQVYNFVGGRIEKKGLTFSMSNKVVTDPELTGYIDEWNPTNEEKAKLVGNLQLLFKHKMIYIPKELPYYDELISELMSFTLINKDGTQQYKAAAGHDDMVIGLALAISAAGGWVYKPQVPYKLITI